jgi:hypothetical protein
MSKLELLPINIAGEWRLGGGDESISLYPATGEAVGRLRAPSLADVNEAIDVASRTIIWPLIEQVWMRSVPRFHGLHGCFALQR